MCNHCCLGIVSVEVESTAFGGITEQTFCLLCDKGRDLKKRTIEHLEADLKRAQDRLASAKSGKHLDVGFDRRPGAAYS